MSGLQAFDGVRWMRRAEAYGGCSWVRLVTRGAPVRRWPDSSILAQLFAFFTILGALREPKLPEAPHGIEAQKVDVFAAPASLQSQGHGPQRRSTPYLPTNGLSRATPQPGTRLARNSHPTCCSPAGTIAISRINAAAHVDGDRIRWVVARARDPGAPRWPRRSAL
jgi:hypothetical protein